MSNITLSDDSLLFLQKHIAVRQNLEDKHKKVEKCFVSFIHNSDDSEISDSLTPEKIGYKSATSIIPVTPSKFTLHNNKTQEIMEKTTTRGRKPKRSKDAIQQSPTKQNVKQIQSPPVTKTTGDYETDVTLHTTLPETSSSSTKKRRNTMSEKIREAAEKVLRSPPELTQLLKSTPNSSSQLFQKSPGDKKAKNESNLAASHPASSTDSTPKRGAKKRSQVKSKSSASRARSKNISSLLPTQYSNDMESPPFPSVRTPLKTIPDTTSKHISLLGRETKKSPSKVLSPTFVQPEVSSIKAKRKPSLFGNVETSFTRPNLTSYLKYAAPSPSQSSSTPVSQTKATPPKLNKTTPLKTSLTRENSSASQSDSQNEEIGFSTLGKRKKGDSLEPSLTESHRTSTLRRSKRIRHTTLDGALLPETSAIQGIDTNTIDVGNCAKNDTATRDKQIFTTTAQRFNPYLGKAEDPVRIRELLNSETYRVSWIEILPHFSFSFRTTLDTLIILVAGCLQINGNGIPKKGAQLTLETSTRLQLETNNNYQLLNCGNDLGIYQIVEKF